MMNNDDTIDPALATRFAALRSELAGHEAPRCVEKELLQAFARQFPKQQPWYRKLSLPQWGAAGALASLGGAGVLTTLLLALAPHQAITVGPPLIGIDDGAAFIALESLEQIAREPSTRVVEAELPQTALAPLGMPLNPQTAGGMVRAEMLVAEDGHPLALRLSAVN